MAVGGVRLVSEPESPPRRTSPQAAPIRAALLSGRLANFSSERLMRLLTRLGQDVEIVVKSKPRRRQHGRIRVVQEARA
jgi:hypothetical protein